MQVASNAAVLSLLCATAAPLANKIHFAPTPGTTLTVSIEQSARTNMVYENWCTVTDGVPDEDSSFNMEGSSSVEFELAIVFEDTYGPIRSDAAKSGIELRLPYGSLSRTFKSLEGDSTFSTFSGGEEEPKTTLEQVSSPLEGRTVDYRWDEASKGFGSAFLEEADEAVDQVLLAGLHVDGTGDWFLPRQEAKGPRGDQNLQPGDKWEVEPSAWYAMLDVGGYFWIGPEPAEAPSQGTLDTVLTVNAQLAKNAGGRILCAFKELREEGGRRLAVFSIDAEIKSQATRDTTEEHDGTREKVAESFAQTIKGRGECLWDIDGRRCHSIQIRSESTDRTTFLTIQRKNARETSGSKVVTMEETVSDFVIEFDVR